MAKKRVTEGASTVSSENSGAAATAKKHHTARTTSAAATTPRKRSKPVVEAGAGNDATNNASISNLADAVARPVSADAEAIARLAYSYWLERGCQGGNQEEDWLRAEAELKARLAVAAR